MFKPETADKAISIAGPKHGLPPREVSGDRALELFCKRCPPDF